MALGTVSVGDPATRAEGDPVVPNFTPLRRLRVDAAISSPVDSVTGALTAVDAPHHMLHEGHAFIAGTVDTTMADTETIIIAFKTQNSTKRAHIIFEFETLVGGFVEVIEGLTWTAETGALLPIYNRKRLATPTASVMLENKGQAGFVASDNLVLNPTGLSGGTVIDNSYAFGSKQVGAQGPRAENELLLQPDTQYAYRFTAVGNSNQAHLKLDWYEHTDSA